MWFPKTGIGEGVNIHLVVLVHVFEEEALKEYLEEDRQVIMSRDKAKWAKWAWPSRCFGGRGLVEEVNRRGGMKKTVKGALKREITEMLLNEDKEGELIPLLLEPLGANLIVYQRREDVDQATGMTPEDNQSNKVVANVEQDENIGDVRGEEGLAEEEVEESRGGGIGQKRIRMGKSEVALG
ncbi:hypothetical protein BGX38DRAFT_1238707 [Terfezia claveryi]|nr:hypothetical protein BGX38DRAFT_1238707 [Terfezia claveryi]